MSPNQLDYTSIGLKPNLLYEILATTFSYDKSQIVPNTASMGVRLVDNNTLKIWPFPSTTTYKNIEGNKLLVINFIDDVFLFALASLKSSSSFQIRNSLSKEDYSYYPLNNNEYNKDILRIISINDSFQIPYLRRAWAIIICYASAINQILKKDDFGKYDLMEVNLSVIFCQKFRESFKLFNRAENLTLETIVLSTKLKVAIEKNDETLIRSIKKKIEENISDIKRFGKNSSALKAIEHIEGYIEGLGS